MSRGNGFAAQRLGTVPPEPDLAPPVAPAVAAPEPDLAPPTPEEAARRVLEVDRSARIDRAGAAIFGPDGILARERVTFSLWHETRPRPDGTAALVYHIDLTPIE